MMSYTPKPPLVPFGEEWMPPRGGVAACMVWNSDTSYKTPRPPPQAWRSETLQRSDYLQRTDPMRSCLKNRLTETQFTMPDGTLSNRYVPTPPPPAHNRAGSSSDYYIYAKAGGRDEDRPYTSRALDTYRDHATHYNDSLARVGQHRPYTPLDDEVGILGNGFQPNPPDVYMASKPPAHSYVNPPEVYRGPRPPPHSYTNPRSHRACHVTTKDVFLLNKAKEEYERSLQEGFIRDRDLESKLYGFNPREVERSRPGSAARSYRMATPSGRRPQTAVGIVDENYQDVHVTWHPDVPESTRSRGLQTTRANHFNDWRHLTTSLAKDSYVDEHGRVVRPTRNYRTYDNSNRDNFGYWKMSKFTKNAKSKLSTHWEPPRSESPPKVNMQVDCPDDSDMLVSLRVRSAKT